MNIIIQQTSGAHYFQHLGWAKVLNYLGHNVILWNPEEKPILDLFVEYPIDIFFGQLYNITSAHIKSFKLQPDCKVILKAGDYGLINYPDWDSKKYPVLLASKQEKKNAELLKDRISFLHIHYHPYYIDKTHGYWLKDYGLKTISSLNAACLFDYTNGQFYPELESDVCFVGNIWPYKSITLEPYIGKLCNPNLNLNVKIFGSGWTYPQYCGACPTEVVKHLFSSSKVCPSISELHSQDYGYDLIERPFKLLSNKSFCISDNVVGFKELFPCGMEFVSSPDELVEKTLYYINNPEKHLPFIKDGYETVIKKHTYFDRISDFFSELGLTNEAKRAIIGKERAIKELSL